jgi:Icc-related predicted phosphoesterase
MRIAPYSDLHTEFDKGVQWTPPALHADVIVFAGDNVTTTVQFRKFAEAVEKRQKSATSIIYVCGNHEFYGASSRFGDHGYEKFRAALMNCPRSRLLEMESTLVQGIRFVAATMWTPVSATDNQTSNDYRYIRIDRSTYRRLLPVDVQTRHYKTVDYLREALAQPKPTVVVTHHPPSRAGLEPEENRSWSADLDELICETRPLAWLHGHVHQSHDTVVGHTRILSNPRGYFPNDLNPEFQPDFVFEI